MGGELILTPDFGRTFFTDWFIKCYSVMFVYFPPLKPYTIYRIGNATNILSPRCKEQDGFTPSLPPILPFIIFYCKMSKNTLD